MYRALDIRYKENTTTYTLVRAQQELGTIVLQVPGRQNVQILWVRSLLLGTRCSFQKDQGGIRKIFRCIPAMGKKRRSERYHCLRWLCTSPDRIKATLAGAKFRMGTQSLCVFQPHLYKPNAWFLWGFRKSFLLSDVLIWPIYPAQRRAYSGCDPWVIVECSKTVWTKMSITFRIE